MKTSIGKTKFLSYLYDQEFWICLGKSTAWIDEDNPDAAVNSLIDVDEPIVFVNVETKKMCKIDQDGTLSYGTIKLKESLEVNWETDKPDHIYCEVTIDSSILDVGVEWRQTGIYINTQRGYSVPVSQTTLYPDLSEVEDTGTLMSYECHTKRSLSPGESRKVICLIEI